MALVKIKVDDTVYEIDGEKLTLGESWLMEREYGVDVTQPIRGFGGFIGLLAIAMRRQDSALTVRQAREAVEALQDERLEVIAEDEPTEDPTPAATGKAGGKAKGGVRAKTPADSGAPS